MDEQKKAKKVSWASGANLCEVKYFKKVDCPAKVQRDTPDHPQLEASHTTNVVSDGGSANINLKIPQVQWKTPPEFVLRPDWFVAAGEESKEKEVQKHRETSVLEAFYPCISAIPPSPFISLNMEGPLYDDNCTPVLPITPKEGTAKTGLSSSPPSNISIDSSPENLLQGSSSSSTLSIKSASTPEPSKNAKSALAMLHSLEGDIMIATVAAANAILKNKEPGSVIDTDLLVQLLKNPEITQELIRKHLPSSVTNTGISESESSLHAVPIPTSKLSIDKSNNENSDPSDAGTEAVRRPLIIKLSSSAHGRTHSISTSSQTVTKPTTQPPAVNPEIGTCSQPKEAALSVSLLCSAPDLLCKKPTNKHSQLANIGTVAMPVLPEPVTDEVGTGSAPKTVTPSVSLLMPVSDLPGKNSTNEYNQQANAGSMVANAGFGTEIREKTGTPPVSSPFSVHNLCSKKSTSKRNQQVDAGNGVVTMPAVTQSGVVNLGTGSGFGTKTGTPPVSLPTLTHDFPGRRSTSEHNQQVSTGKEVIAMPAVTESVAVHTRTGTGFRVKPGLVPMSVHDMPDKKCSNEANAVAALVAENQPLVPMTNALINAVAAAVGEYHPPYVPRMKSQFLGIYPMGKQSNKVNGCHAAGTPPHYVSSPVLESVHLNGPNLEISRLKKLIDEHGAHFEGGQAPVAGINLIFPNPSGAHVEGGQAAVLGINPIFPNPSGAHVEGGQAAVAGINPIFPNPSGAHVEGGQAAVAGINPIFPNPSGPDMQKLKKLVSEYGLHDNTEIPLPSSEHLLVPSSVTMFATFSPSGELRQPPQLLQAPFSGSPLMEFEPKFQKPCLYYNTPKGCRNGSSCRFLHVLSKQCRSGGMSEAPNPKRMKPDKELTGRT